MGSINIFILLSVLAITKALLMTSFLPKLWHKILFAAICSLFVYLSHSFAISYNIARLREYLYTPEALMDISLLIMLDLILTFTFFNFTIKIWLQNKLNNILKIFVYLPTLLVFPAIFYLHVNLIYYSVGIDFLKVSNIFAIITLLFIGAGAVFINKLLKETEFRLELLTIVSILIIVLSISSTVFHPTVIVYNHTAPAEWDNLLIAAFTISALFIIGFFKSVFINFFKSFIRNGKRI
jgi:hypothetical protein